VSPRGIAWHFHRERYAPEARIKQGSRCFPAAGGCCLRLNYEEQRAAAKLATKYFWRHRLPKFLRYFERVLQISGGPYVLGRKLSYVDLSLFQIVEGLRYAFPKRMKRFERKVPDEVRNLSHN
jgi:Glutathione S-transferase, C-terminal domain